MNKPIKFIKEVYGDKPMTIDEIKESFLLYKEQGGEVEEEKYFSEILAIVQIVSINKN